MTTCQVFLSGEPVTVHPNDLHRIRQTAVSVGAVQMSLAFEVEWNGARLVGAPGDYLIEGQGGERYPMPQQLFHLLYRLED